MTPLLLLLLLLIAVTLRDLTLLLSYPVAAGLDGYYYVLQVDEFLKLGRFYFPSNTPFVFLFLAGIRLLTGDTVLAVKIGGVALHALLCLGLFALIKRVTRSAWLGVTGSTLASASQLHLFMVAEFIKNLCAVTLLVWCGWCVIYALRTRNDFRRWLLALVVITAAVFSHRSVIFVTAVLGASVLLVRTMTSSKTSGRYQGAAVAAALALWCAPMLAARQTLIGLPPWLANELTGAARWPISEIASVEKIVLLVACPATLLVVTIFRERLSDGPAATIFGSVALFGLLLTLNPFLNYDLGWVGISVRLSCLAYVQLAILVPGLIWMLRHISRETTVYAAVLTASLLIILNAYGPLPLGMRPNFMAEREQLIQALRASRQQLDPDSLVIAPHGDQFVVTSVLDIPSQQLWPQEGESRDIYWLLRYIDDQALDASMIVLTTENGGLHTVMVRDDDLRRRLRTMTGAEQMRLFMNNSHLQKKYGADTLGRGPNTKEF